MNSSENIYYVQTRGLRVITASVLLILSMAATAWEGKQYVVLDVENPRYCGNELPLDD